MEGREVFKHAVGDDHRRDRGAFKATGYTAADIDWFVPHQANQRIIDASAQKLGIAPEKVITRSTSTATRRRPRFRSRWPTRSRDGRIKRGDLVMLEAMGGGFTWGAVLRALVRHANRVAVQFSAGPLDPLTCAPT